MLDASVCALVQLWVSRIKTAKAAFSMKEKVFSLHILQSSIVPLVYFVGLTTKAIVLLVMKGAHIFNGKFDE